MGTWLNPTRKYGVCSDPASDGIRSAVVLIHLKDYIDYFEKKSTLIENTGELINQEHLVAQLMNTLFICFHEMFCQRCMFSKGVLAEPDTRYLAQTYT